MVVSSSFWGIVAYASVAFAGLCKPSGDVCSEIKRLLGDEAVPLCSSYVQATPATVTVTSTTTRTRFQTIISPPETISTLVEETTTVAVTQTISYYPPDPTVTETFTISVKTAYVYRPNEKREAGLETVLASLENKYSEAAVTAGCNCVYDPTTETITQTTDVTAEATSQVTAGPLTTVVVTEVKYVPITKATAVVVTVEPYGTSTETVTTVEATETRAASCNVAGYPKGEFNYDYDQNIDLKTCIERCRSARSCFMSGWYPNFCRYYTGAVAEAGESDPQGYYTLNDKDCPS
ncbi:hypothetical protein FSPOR_6965 [Fusarium sporotrichioides]|uniref:Apple domain-containing protein n=1 Tax=Fusarium sporotrichioides TaxID=5514 RepID=A0A395S262_FUSSP|nr:hypothetical protein FSPOR_6965 [Fusarium sporotrichioides]